MRKPADSTDSWTDFKIIAQHSTEPFVLAVDTLNIVYMISDSTVFSMPYNIVLGQGRLFGFHLPKNAHLDDGKKLVFVDYPLNYSLKKWLKSKEIVALVKSYQVNSILA